MARGFILASHQSETIGKLMPTLLLEGFDNWATNYDGLGKGWTQYGSLVAGRFGGQGLATGLSQTSNTYPNQTHIYVGVAVLGSYVAYNPGYLLYAGGYPNRVGLYRMANGQMFMSDANETKTIISSYEHPPAGVWTYLEMEMIASSSATGTINVWQDGRLIYTNTAIQNCVSGSVFFNAITLSGPQLDSGPVFDDFYLSNSSRFGPMQIVTIYPTGDSGAQGWAPNSGTACWSRLNEAQEDGDTSYVSAAGSSYSCNFTMQTVPVTLGTPICVQAVVNGKNTVNSIATRVISGSTTHTSPFASLSANYTNRAPDILDLDPNGNIPWTSAAVNALNAGFINGAP